MSAATPVQDRMACTHLPVWEIRSTDRRVDRACRSCLDPVLDSICRDWDGFAPITVTPLTARGGIT